MVAGKTRSLEVVGSEVCNVRFGSGTDIPTANSEVRFNPQSRHRR
jgi:hypothetical protein